MKRYFLGLAILVLLFNTACDNEPLEIELQDPSGVACDQATVNTAAAALAFASATDENYTQLCTALVNALQVQISACGDPDGTLQLQIDVLGSCTNNPVDNCDVATEALAIALLAFNNASDDDYTTLCNAYKTALQNVIDLCGDPDGSYQATIDGLGDCSLDQPNAQITLTAGNLPIDFDVITVEENGNFLEITGETSGPENYTVYFEVAMGTTGIDIINSTFVLTFTSTFFPSTQGVDDFTSEITENTQNTLVGTFSGLMENNDNADLSITSGTINISY